MTTPTDPDTLTIPTHAPMSERQLQAAILEAAGYLGWTCSHPFLSLRSAAGWPDLFCIRDGQAIALELKSARGRLTPAQAAWLEALGAVPGIAAHVIRPEQWRDGTVERILRGA